MAVKIELDLDANGATGKIGAVAASLKGLEQVANDIDIDFDADVSEITEEIEAFADALDGIETGNLGFVQDLDNVADKLDEALDQEIDVNTKGATNAGDSSGNDPPRQNININTADLRNAVDKATASTDGGDRANLLERTYGEHTLMSNSDVGDVFKTRNSQTSNLGESAPGFSPQHQMKRLGTRTGFGLDPESMNLRRMFADESMEAIQKGADPSHGADRKRVDTLEDRIQDFKKHSVNMVDGFSELMEKRDEAASPIETPFGDRGRNFDKRMSELTTEELNDIKDPQTGGGLPGQMFGGGQDYESDFARRIGESDAITESIDELKDQQRELFESAGLDEDGKPTDSPFGGVNSGLRESELSGSEMYDIYRDSEPGGEPLDMSSPGRKDAPGVGFSVGGRGGRSNSDIIEGNSVLSRVDNMTSLSNVMDEVGDAQSKFGKKLRKLKPTMGKYMQLFAALIPVALALGTQLLGVAAAMGSVAAAGGAVIGLGLLGHAESMEGAMANAKSQIRDLKSELFETFQPTMQQFAPVQAGMFDAIPEALDPVAEQMEGLVAFEDTFGELGSALAGGLEEALAIIVENEQAIGDLATTFGGLIGSGLLKFFEWLIQAASKNQQLLIQLGQDMIKLAVAAYNVSMAIAKILTAFSPLFDLLVFISEVLNSEIVIGLIAMVGWMYVLGKTVGLIYAVYTGFMTLASGIADAALMMFGYEMSTWGAVAATLALVAAIGLLTLGAATVIGGAVTAGAMGAQDTPTGPSGGGGGRGPGGGGKTVYNDNRSFQINNAGGDDYASQKATEDVVREVGETNEAQSLPPVATSSDDSDEGSD